MTKRIRPKETRTRRDRARPSLEVIATVYSVMHHKRTDDYLVLYCIKAWDNILSHLVDKDYLLATLREISEKELDECLQRLRNKRAIAIHFKRGGIVITDKGREELIAMQGRRSEIWKRVDDKIAAKKLEHINKLNDDKARRKNEDS